MKDKCSCCGKIIYNKQHLVNKICRVCYVYKNRDRITETVEEKLERIKREKCILREKKIRRISGQEIVA